MAASPRQERSSRTDIRKVEGVRHSGPKRLGTARKSTSSVNATLAQLAERSFAEWQVAGSSPAWLPPHKRKSLPDDIATVS